MQKTSFLVILLLCTSLVNKSYGFFVEQSENNNNETKIDKNNFKATLTEKIVSSNIQSAVLTSIGNSIPQAIIPQEGRKSRLNKQQEEPLLLMADRILKQITQKKGGEYSGKSQFYRTHSDKISETVVQNGYYHNTNYRIFSSEISFTKIGDRQETVDSLIVIKKPVDLSIQITEEEARIIALDIDDNPSINPEDAIVELVILPSCFSNNNNNEDDDLLNSNNNNNKYYCNNKDEEMTGTLTYLVELPNNNIYFISAQSGENLFSYSYDSAAFATTYYNGNVSINSYLSSGNYYMEDLSRNHTTINCNYGDCTTTSKLIDGDNIWTSEKIGNQVQWGVGQVLDYFKQVHGRNGLDGNGGPLSILSENGQSSLLANKIHYGTDPNYSGWTGTELIFGDGDGVQYGPMVSLDIVAHEMAHAIIEFQCNLNYFGESGAIAESFGDITAAAVSAWTYGENNGTWQFGEEVYTPGVAGDAIRYLNEPSLSGPGYPDHYSEMYNGTDDNGGVHVNAGILNKVFYLLAKGGNHSNGGPTMTGIGINASYAILYRAVTTYFLSTTNFADARTALEKAARDIYNTSNCWQFTEVQAAFALCGIGALPNNYKNVLSNPGLESTISPWVLSGTGVTFIARGSPGEAKAGYGYVKFGVNNLANGYLAQSNWTIPINTVVANLTFWIFVTTAEPNPLVPNDRLWVELYNSTNGVLLNQLAVYSNGDASATWIQKYINLIGYVNRPGLQIRFRQSNDNNYPSTFRLDEIYLYCTNY